MTGSGFTLQPFVSEDEQRVALLNGEIYNFKDFGDYNSDGEAILPLYEKYGVDFVHKLDGEFAIVVVDYKKNIALYTTDVFGTKPLWFAMGGNASPSYAKTMKSSTNDVTAIGVATYKSALVGIGFPEKTVTMATPNTATVISLDAPYKVIDTKTLYEFDLRQYKTDTDDWDEAFRNALKKRVEHVKHPVFVALSGGYDSGLISAGLYDLGFKHHTITIMGDSEDDIVHERNKLCGELCLPTQITVSISDIEKQKKWIKNEVEAFVYDIPYPGAFKDKLGVGNGRGQGFFHYSIKKDEASVGVSTIMSLAREREILVYLSGGGVDEIYSDYGILGEPIYGKKSQSSFAGLFPEKLEEIFPWSGFFAGTQRAFLMKEEHVGGSHGVETRYPYLDTQLVQEYLWLSAELKNSVYKMPIDNFMTQRKYPFSRGVKKGFHVSKCWRTLEPKIGYPLWIGPLEPLNCGFRGFAVVCCYIVLILAGLTIMRTLGTAHMVFDDNRHKKEKNSLSGVALTFSQKQEIKRACWGAASAFIIAVALMTRL
eukprot:CAMPEP_0185730070 /NCGR_PEP_ID=MMETSP1171-20130828/8394_1 /TAXON_ID=374046 /ORGANISM="Helicotheca tamensis, Strain CCMP826" /LENGTH=539 /DNA_ID=CAMNT_0028399053 /DNA_START=244 /DNA_END=1863 /DNA_ORIENTATION=+